MELVERDAFLIAWYAKARLVEIDPRSSASQRSRMMVARMSMYGYDVRLFDTRIEFPVPVVTAVAQRRDDAPGALLFAAGASLDPEEALASGLYEIASECGTFQEDSAAIVDELRVKAADFTKVRWLGDHATLYGLPEMATHARHLLGGAREPRPMAEVYREWQAERPRSLDLRDDVRYCVDLVAAAGFDVIVVDQTSPEQREIGLHTASVIVPGLLPIDFGWTRQRALHLDRTRTVLRRIGWRSTDLRPDELNLAPHPFP
jgi:ribosomal protein S12 methylthiotransferase accessory factor